MGADQIDRDAVSAVLHRYVWFERLLRIGLAVLIVVLILLTYTVSTLLIALLVALSLVLALKIPIFQTEGNVRLKTEKSSAAVAEMFGNERPPILAFQWGLADDISSTEDGAVYSFSYLFGLRTVTMGVKIRQNNPEAGDATDTELAVFVGGQPWATYHVSWSADTDDTVIDIVAKSDRRFGLGRLTQWLSANYWYEDMLDAQGFSVTDRERSFRR